MGIAVRGPGLHCMVMTLVGGWQLAAVNGPITAASHQPSHYHSEDRVLSLLFPKHKI